ncbi:MAG: PD-(D/E)XK nuclease family protein [Beutenbergiaceae bacterium]
MKLDRAQRAARDAVLAGGNQVILGAAGTGLTTTALHTFATWAEHHPPEAAVLLVPTRLRAGMVRDQLARRMQRTTGSVLVRTPASLAYAILRLRASLRGEPAPTLVTGPEQDRILAELLAGHLAGEGAQLNWPAHLDRDVLALPAFRDELRDLLMRANEAGIDGPGLVELGHRRRRQHWCAAGRLLTEYQDVMALGENTPDRGARYDAATIVDQAVVALAGWDAELGPAQRPHWQLVMHDDYQDATLATARLLTAMAGAGSQIAVWGDPDRAVQSFRGGMPTLLDAATRDTGTTAGLGASMRVLTTSYRHGPQLRTAMGRLTSELPVLSGQSRREARAAGPTQGLGAGEDQAVRHLLLPTQPQEVAAVARELRIAHLRHQVPWSQMAVIVRSSARVGQMRRGLRTAGIPLATAVPDRPLRSEPAVRPLLVALQAVIADAITTDQATTLLLSPYGGLDAVSLRTLRRLLRQQDPATGSDELLSEVVARQEVPAVAALPGRLRRAVEAVARILAAGRQALATDMRNTEMVLWQMWEAAQVAQDWQQRALAGGAAADRADADLDAVLSLFALAEQFSDRTTGAHPVSFLEFLEQQNFAADSLAARGDGEQTVAVHTAVSAIGREWDVVVVSGIQEDSWPDLRIRDTLLGAQELADLVAARESHHGGGGQLPEQLRAARQAVRADELRAFVAACSRARRQLILSAVLDTDSRPSAFYQALLPVDAPALPPVTPVEAAMDLRGLTGQLRAALHGGDGRAAAAADLLDYLHQHEVPYADPALWSDHAHPSSTADVYGSDELVPVSPSTIEDAWRCPLRWLLTRAGGRPHDTRAQSLGNLIHEIAASLPHGTGDQLRSELDRRWHELGMPDSWMGRQERARAEAMIDRLADYLAQHPGPAQVEQDFDVQVGQARLRGRMDRLEVTDAGLRVVDLKTGSTAATVADTARHAQLGSYQLAVTEGGVGPHPSAGAALVYVGTTAKSATVREQGALADDPQPDWARELIDHTVQTLQAAEFEARENPMCRTCPVRTSCPVQPDGARVEQR